MHHYKWNIGDYFSRTAHLTLLEDIAYRRMIDHYHMTEHPLPTETQTVSRLIRMSEHCELVERILNEFFFLKKDGWHQQRCDNDIEEYRNRSKINKEVGKLGGRPKKTQTVITDNPDGYENKPNRNPNQEPRTNNQEPETNIVKISSADKQPTIDRHRLDRFEEVWSAYQRPDGKGSKKKAIEEWKKLTLEQKKDAWAMVDEYLKVTWQEGGKFRPHVERYLKNRLWEGLDTNNGRKE